jgi:hypothetical protein
MLRTLFQSPLNFILPLLFLLSVQFVSRWKNKKNPNQQQLFLQLLKGQEGKFFAKLSTDKHVLSSKYSELSLGLKFLFTRRSISGILVRLF